MRFNQALVFTFFLFLFPLSAFAGVNNLEKKIVGKWEVRKAMSAGKRSLKSDDITKRYEGNTLTFYEDKTVDFFRRSDSTTYRGTWEIGEDSYHKVNARDAFDRNEFNTLDMELVSGTKKLRIDGKMLKIRKTELEYKEYKGDLNYWYLFERVE